MTEPHIMLDLGVWTYPTWSKYGLTNSLVARLGSTGYSDTDPLHPHNLVCSYLDRHPEISAQYRPDQSGTVTYEDVLRMAEREAGLEWHFDPKRRRWWYTSISASERNAVD